MGSGMVTNNSLFRYSQAKRIRRISARLALLIVVLALAVYPVHGSILQNSRGTVAPNKVALPTVKGISKVVDQVPTHVPKNWSKADISDAIETYRHSIALRKAEAGAFDAAGGGYVWARKARFERIVQEENFLRKMLKRLEDM
jgi:hypothetical protein